MSRTIKRRCGICGVSKRTTVKVIDEKNYMCEQCLKKRGKNFYSWIIIIFFVGLIVGLLIGIVIGRI
ncbi:hypothetical protein LCGC14_2579430 [marine sediment metagenome]|uniref:Uncharacterized protein n=1 Tax=marine sediment metagenome TaxID=412755 RepID=A0A0F9AES7_9ZZZZ